MSGYREELGAVGGVVAQPGGSLSDLFPGGLGGVLSENFIRSGFAPTRRAANRCSITRRRGRCPNTDTVDVDLGHSSVINHPNQDLAKNIGGNLEQYSLSVAVAALVPRRVPGRGTGLTPGRSPPGPLHDATRSPPVSALKRVQLPFARAEPAGGCCSRGSSCRS